MKKNKLLWLFLPLAIISSQQNFALANDKNVVRPVVNLGKEGWLFQDEELTGFDSKSTEKLIEKLKIFNNFFAKRNTRLIFTIIPTKYDIYGNYAINQPDYTLYNYDCLENIFKQHMLLFVNVEQPLKEAADRGLPVWLHSDTHMSPQGSQIVGENIGRFIVQNKMIKNLKSEKIQLYFERQVFPGDLWRFLDTAHQKDYMKSESIIIPKLRFMNKSDNLFSDASSSIFLIGTSYSVKPSNALEVGIEEKIKNDVVNLGLDGGGIWGSMNYYLKTQIKDVNPPDIIIWEIPQRMINLNSINSYTDFEEVKHVIEK